MLVITALVRKNKSVKNFIKKIDEDENSDWEKTIVKE